MEYLFPRAGKVLKSKVSLQHLHVLKPEVMVEQPGGFGAGFASLNPTVVGSEILGATAVGINQSTARWHRCHL